MKILIASHSFAPALGGIEQVSQILAREFAALGHSVRVVTRTPADREEAAGYTVHRAPSLRSLWQLLRWADVYLQSNIALHSLWPALLARTPTLVVYHTWLQRADGRIAWQDRLKRLASRLVTRNLAVSACLARSLPARCGVIPNPYNDALFTCEPRVQPDAELLFLGRLVSDKGADLLLDALALLAVRGLKPRLSVIGSGPEEPALRTQAARLQLQDRVDFQGALRGPALVERLRAHRILVVPSRWAEPFGLVALEGMACGLEVVAADIGGLPEALGGCGSTFTAGDARALADQLAMALARPVPQQRPSAEAVRHLARHRAGAVAHAYLAQLAELAPARAPAATGARGETP